MKTLTHSTAAKACAIVLFVLMSLAVAIGGIALIFMADEGFFGSEKPDYFESGYCSSQAWMDQYDAFTGVFNYWLTSDEKERAYIEENMADYLPYSGVNFMFRVSDADGEVLLSTYDEEVAVGFSESVNRYGYDLSSSYENYENEEPVLTDPEAVYTVDFFVRAELQPGDAYYKNAKLYDHLYDMRTTVIVLTCLAFVLGLALFIFLLTAAGKRRDREGAVLNPLDKIPFDLYAVILAGLATASAAIAVSVDNGQFMTEARYWVLLVMVPFAAVVPLMFAALCMSLASRIKCGGWWRNTLIYLLGRGLWRLFGKIRRGIVNFVHELPVLWKTVLGFLLYLLINFILALNVFGGYGSGLALFLGIIFNVLVLAALCRVTLNLRKLKKGAEKLAAGDLSYTVDTEKMFWEFKKHGENLNNVGTGMARAVEERMKSEHFKTELITNVSHDLKTPLTSIINYVDLLKKEELDNEQANGYLEVLDRQSAKLKKLTEDLVEASKASTGNITVHALPTNVVELLNQSVGEYAERLEANHIQTIVSVPEDPVVVLADGRLLWRVFDNLLGNIAKYGQSHTRAYFQVLVNYGHVRIVMKNVSREILNITADELMERFVRGDSARSSEGSGLGLSIARSLTELQGGRLDLFVDGDLFKVILSFDVLDDRSSHPFITPESDSHQTGQLG